MPYNRFFRISPSLNLPERSDARTYCLLPVPYRLPYLFTLTQYQTLTTINQTAMHSKKRKIR